MGTQAFSYEDKAIREDLWDQIKDLDPLETYVTSNAPRVDVTQKVHSWVSDPITATTTAPAGVVEGADTSYTVTDPTTTTNMTQIFEKGFKVPMTTENSKHAGFSSRFAREQVKAMKMWKNDYEYAVTVGSIATGNSSTARKMNGMVRFASTLTTGMSSITLTSSLFNTYMGNGYDQGAEFDTILVGRHLKETISGFTAGNTRNIEAKAAELVGRIDVYDGDHGRHKIIKHRYVNYAATASHYALVGYMSDYISVGFLDEPHFEDRAKTGYFKAGSIVGEGTVQVANEKAITFINGLK